MEIPWDWIIVIGGITLALYAAFVIKEEKEAYADSAIDVKFHDFILKVPSWWGQTLDEENTIRFERTDTRYDWYAVFKKVKYASDPKVLLDATLAELNIILDEDATVLDDQAHVILNTELRESLISNNAFIRKESTGTQDEENRLYFDIAVINSPIEKASYIMYSRSSVLNGLVEGPYFEEVLKRL